MTLRLIRSVLLTLLALAVTEAAAAQAPPTEPRRRPRASWLVNRQQLSVGDIVTVVVDEQVSADERANRIASEDRRLDMSLTPNFPDFTLPVTSAALGSSNDAETRNLGQATRRGALASVFTVRIVGVEESGMLRLEGQRMVEIDGRSQEMALTGLIRPEDVSADNLVFSNRIADANIAFTGTNISPSRGIIAKILGIFWP